MKDGIFEIGDKVIVKRSGVKVRGIITSEPLHFDTIFTVKYETPIIAQVHPKEIIKSSLHHINSMELDVQYYREERLRKLLNKET